MNGFLKLNQSKVIEYLQDAAVLVHGATSLPTRQPVDDAERQKAFAQFRKLVHPLVGQVQARAKVLFAATPQVAEEQM